RQTLSNVTQEIFGIKPHKGQLDLAEKVLQGFDCIGVAGTGSGKSLIFAILAIAAELSGSNGVVIVICPLKSLKKDQ
ncbi:hypothetical protein FA15DRAFT_559422, partial [Coprinopsis marcescibilis]